MSEKLGERSAVYSTREKMLLTQLVKENSIIENKKTDGATVAEKNQAWEALTTSYNSQPEVNTVRTQQQLRKLWNNLKQRKHKETTDLRHDMLATGGGPPKMIKLDPVLKFVSEAAASLDVTVKCPWDSTHIFEKAKNTCLELGDNAEQAQEEVNEATNELLCNSSAEPVPSYSQETDELSDEYFTKVPATPSCAEAVVAIGTKNSQSLTTPKRDIAAKKVQVSADVRHNRLVEAAHQQL